MSPETIAMLCMARQAVNFIDQIGRLEADLKNAQTLIASKDAEIAELKKPRSKAKT